MVRPILLVPVIFISWLFINTSNKHILPPDGITPQQTVTLNCRDTVVFFFDVTSNGITVPFDSLIESASSSTGCGDITYILTDNLGITDTNMIDYGLNDLFLNPMCITIKAYDECGLDTATCKVNISILDTLPPTIKCPADQKLCEFSAIPAAATGLTSFLAQGGMLMDATFSGSEPNNFIRHLGDVIVRMGCNRRVERKYEGRDWFNNKDTCSQFFTITDTIQYTSPASYNLTTDPGVCTKLHIPTISFNANCEIDTFFHNGTVSNIYNVGNTLVRFTIVNMCNDTFRRTDTIRVRDVTPPSIVCPNNITIQCAAPAPYATVPLFDAAPNGVATDNCSILPNAISSTDATVPGVCPQIITRTYTITDINGNSSTCNQSIRIQDTNKPTIQTLANITIGTNNNACNASNVTLTPPTTTDNCTAPVIVTRLPSGNIFNLGNTTVVWTATDGCGNTATSSQTITVVDDDAPNLVCAGPKVISLGSNTGYAITDTLVLSSSDNCGSVTRSARRMTSTCTPATTTFGDRVYFCCADIASSPIQVIVRVTDQAGNSSTCMLNFTVQDKLAPRLEEDLPDITISCDFPIQLSNLSIFGKYVFDQDDRDTVRVNDTLFNLFHGFILDGYIEENCSASIVEQSPLDQRNQHNTGSIIRRFLVTDNSGNTLTLNQSITIQDADPMVPSDITWPPDVDVTDCVNFPPPTSVTGQPTFRNDDICTIPMATFKDQIFDDPTSGCIYIRRKWKVIDWARYNPNANNNVGLFERIQNIHLINKVKPVFTSSCSNRTINAVNAECDAMVRLGAKATDDCTKTKDLAFDFKLDVDNNGTVDYQGPFDTLAYRLPRGQHAVTWRVEDRCGNLNTCSYIVTVRENKAPTPVCLFGLSTNLENDATSVIWASDFNNHSFDNCTPESQLKYSFSTNVNDTGKTLNCNTRGNVNVSVWVTDNEGNQSKCNTFITVTDLKNLCPAANSNSNITLAGRIATEENGLMKELDITLDDNGTKKSLRTDSEGTYMVNNLEMYKNYIVAPVSLEDWLNGVSTLDLVMIQRHVLGIKKLVSPYKIIAADINNDQKISASDLVSLRKLVLGVTKEVDNNHSWRFINKNFVFPNPDAPWPFEEKLDFDSLDVNIMNGDFIAVKTGDINGNVVQNIKKDNLENRSENLVDLILEDNYFEANKYINIPIHIGDEININTIQMSLKLDKNLDFHGILNESLNLENADYHFDPESHTLNLSYFNTETTPIRENGVLFTIQLKSNSKGKLSESINLNQSKLEAQVSDERDELYKANLVYSNGYEVLNVSQNVPNPFAEQTDVKFFLAETGLVEISIYDNSGKLIHNQIKNYSGGVNQIRIDKDQLGDLRGVFYLHIATGEKKEIKKMLRLN